MQRASCPVSMATGQAKAGAGVRLVGRRIRKKGTCMRLPKKSCVLLFAAIAGLAAAFVAELHAAQPPGSAAGDRLIIKGIPAGQDVVVMLDGRGPDGKCINDLTFRSTGVSELP